MKLPIISKNPPKIIDVNQMYFEQRKGYRVIHFLCDCGVQGRRRYYVKSFKRMCRKCLREHNKKEKIERGIKSREAAKRMLELMEKSVSGNVADDIGWDLLMKV